MKIKVSKGNQKGLVKSDPTLPWTVFCVFSAKSILQPIKNYCFLFGFNKKPLVL